MSPVGASSRVRFPERALGQKEGYQMVTYSDMSPSCSLMFKFIGPEEFTRSIIVDLIPVCGLGGSVGVQYTIGV